MAYTLVNFKGKRHNSGLPGGDHLRGLCVSQYIPIWSQRGVYRRPKYTSYYTAF